LGEVPIRQHVVTIPKMLRLCFKYDRKLLGELSRSYYESIKELFLDAVVQAECSPADSPALPAMIASIQTYGDDPTRYHPHLHCLVADGLILRDGSFLPIPRPDPVQIMLLFRHKLLKTLLAKEKISPSAWLTSFSPGAIPAFPYFRATASPLTILRHENAWPDIVLMF